jgi:hypothetical protein
MATKKKTKKTTGAKNGEGTGPQGENLDVVRDLLFGSQMRSAEDRMARLEERLQRDLEKLRDSATKQMGDLDKAFRKEVAALTRKLKTEQDKRADELRNVGAKIGEMATNLETRIEEAEAKGDESEAGVRAEIAEQSRAVAKDLGTLAKNLSSDMTKEVTELRTDKTDTAALVDLFSEMAFRLSEQIRSSSEE